MCGIVGFINIGNKELLKKSCDIMTHRGPDDSGLSWFHTLNSGLAHRRLSIIDLSPTGHQPMCNDNENLWITYNGEIYNFQEIKEELRTKGYKFRSKSDTEVLLKAYEEWGVECLQKLNGMFAFAVFDIKKRTLFAARDRLGIKPFYYWQQNNSLIFSSEIKGILETGLIQRFPDLFSLFTPTRFQIEPYTGYKDIYKLPQGNYIIFKDGKLEINKYWDIEISENEVCELTAINELDALLSDSVKMQMIADVPVGIFLSGGIDSSIIASLMKKNTLEQINSFTIKFSRKDQKYEKMPDDSYYAKKVADKFGFKHFEFEISPDIKELLPKLVWHLDEPLADPASINTYIISKAARESGIIVLLNGVGGDEIFGGYRKQLACLKADVYQEIIPKFLREYIEKMADRLAVATTNQGLRTIRWLKRFLSFASMPQCERFLMSDLSLSPTQYKKLFNNGVDYYQSHFYKSQKIRLDNYKYAYLTRMCFNDSKVMLAEHNLLYTDKATMAASVESRPPLLDHRIVEYIFSLSPKYKIKGNIQKYLLKKVALNYLPNEIIKRKKAPFGSPLRSWIRGELADMVRDFLSEETIKKRGLYNYKFIAKAIDDDRKGKEDNAHLIWTLLTNEIWFRTFFTDN